MTYEELEKLWVQPGNGPSAEEAAHLKAELIRRVRRRRLFEGIWIAWTFIALSLSTGIVARVLLRGDSNAGLGWSALPLLLVPWLVIAHRFRQRRLRAQVALGLSTREVLHRAKAEHLALCARIRAFAFLWVLSLPAFGFLMANLRATGKAQPSELASMGVLLGTLLLGAASLVAWVWFNKLRPEGERLASLLASLEDPS